MLRNYTTYASAYKLAFDKKKSEQAMLGDFPKAVEEAVLSSGDAHQELMSQFLANKAVQTGFARMLLEILAKSA